MLGICLSRCRPATMSLAVLLFVAACGDHDTAPLESAPPFTSTAEADASGTELAIQAHNTWSRQTDLPGQRSSPILAAVAKANGNSRLFAIGGDLVGTRPNGSLQFTPIGTVSEWLPNNDRWAKRADAPYVWQGNTPIASVIGSKVFIPSGFIRCANCQLPQDRMAIYDATADAWTTVALPQIATGALTWALDGKLYWGGQCNDDETFDSGEDTTVCTDTGARRLFLLRYNPANGNWVYLASPTHEITGVAGAIGGKLYAAATGRTDVYDPATNRWTSAPAVTLPSTDYLIGGAAVGAKLYVAASGVEETTTPPTATRAFDPATGQWAVRAALPERFPSSFGFDVQGVRVQVGGQPRLAIIGGFGHHWQYAP
jgi:hypothetical protein